MLRVLVLLACVSSGLAEIHYEIDVRRAPARMLTVTVEADCLQAECDFQMPVWNALYRIRDFAQYATRFEAYGRGGRTLAVRLLAPSRWAVSAEPGERVRLRYQYLAENPGPFGASASSRHVFLNFAQVLVYPVGQLSEAVSVSFRNVPESWRIAVELPGENGVYRAASYHDLADAPAELSAFTERQFQVAGKRVRLVVDAAPEEVDLEVLADMVQRIARTGVAIMGDAPFPSYTFFYHFRPGGGGGMEHANSTVIEGRTPCRGDCNLASVTAHEFFHLWNVKRIRPRSLETVDYTKENLTPSLWFSEGVTSTYASYILLQSGLEAAGDFLTRLQDQITAYERLPARLTQSAEESSLSAWLERYPAYLRPERSVSYYLKGELIGYLLDLTIRRYSDNARSLDDVMRRLNTEYAQRGRAFEETAAIERLASEAAGRNLQDFFDRLVRRAEPVDWERYLGYAGYRLKRLVTRTPTLRARTSRAPDYGVVTEVDPDGPGAQAGLDPGDRILALNERPIGDSLEEALAASGVQPGETVTLRVERRRRSRTVTATPEFTQQTAYQIEDKPRITPKEKKTRRGWLRSAAAESGG